MNDELPIDFTSNQLRFTLRPPLHKRIVCFVLPSIIAQVLSRHIDDSTLCMPIKVTLTKLICSGLSPPLSISSCLLAQRNDNLGIVAHQGLGLVVHVVVLSEVRGHGVKHVVNCADKGHSSVVILKN